MPFHDLFVFTDAQFEDAFTRGYEEGKAQRPALPVETHIAEFEVDAGAGPRRGTLSFTILPPLAEAFFAGWRAGLTNERTRADISDAARAHLSIWRQSRYLQFQVHESEDPAFDESELGIWNTLFYELAADGIEPTQPSRPWPAFTDTRDWIGDLAARETPLRFPVADTLTSTNTTVTLSVRLGDEERLLVFAL